VQTIPIEELVRVENRAIVTAYYSPRPERLVVEAVRLRAPRLPSGVSEDAGRRIIEPPDDFGIFVFHDQFRCGARSLEKRVRAVSPNHRKPGGILPTRLIE